MDTLVAYHRVIKFFILVFAIQVPSLIQRSSALQSVMRYKQTVGEEPYDLISKLKCSFLES